MVLDKVYIAGQLIRIQEIMDNIDPYGKNGWSRNVPSGLGEPFNEIKKGLDSARDVLEPTFGELLKEAEKEVNDGN